MTIRALSLVAALPCALAAQPTRLLGRADVEHPGVFSSITALRELSDGRVLLVDRRERAVHLADFQRGTVARIGREGAGPLEISEPTTMLALPGDTTAIWDSRNARLFLVDASGVPTHTSRVVDDVGRAPAVALRAPRFADDRGRLYFVGVSGEGDSTDSIAIIRWERSSGRVDTVGQLRRPERGQQAVLGPPGRQMTMNFANPFSPQEDWVVTADGRVGVVRSPVYRLDWTFPAPSRGREISYVAITLTESEKALWRRSQRGVRPSAVRDVDARGQGAAPPVAGSVPEPTSWPSALPPFLASGTPVLADKLGRVWVARARAASDSVPAYDVLDARGDAAMRVTLPPQRRIVGFGRDVVYTVRTDESDRVHLSKHSLPR